VKIPIVKNHNVNYFYIRLFVTKTEYSKDTDKQTDRQTNTKTDTTTTQ